MGPLGSTKLTMRVLRLMDLIYTNPHLIILDSIVLQLKWLSWEIDSLRFKKSPTWSRLLIDFKDARWGHLFSPWDQVFPLHIMNPNHVKVQLTLLSASLLELQQISYSILALDQFWWWWHVNSTFCLLCWDFSPQGFLLEHYWSKWWLTNEVEDGFVTPMI